MIKFFIFYGIMLIALFEFFYWADSPLAKQINDFQSNLTLGALKPFLKPGQLVGADIVISPTYRLIITQACNGLIPFFIFFAAVLATPTTWLNRLFWVFIGYVIFFIINITRLLLVTHYVTETPRNFQLSHDIFGNMLLMITGMILFFYYLKSSDFRF